VCPCIHRGTKRCKIYDLTQKKKRIPKVFFSSALNSVDQVSACPQRTVRIHPVAAFLIGRRPV
jgi:hypothetical protein